MEVLCTIKLSFNTTVFTYITFNIHLHTAHDKNSVHNIINSITYGHINTHSFLLVGYCLYHHITTNNINIVHTSSYKKYKIHTLL